MPENEPENISSENIGAEAEFPQKLIIALAQPTRPIMGKATFVGLGFIIWCVSSLAIGMLYESVAHGKPPPFTFLVSFPFALIFTWKLRGLTKIQKVNPIVIDGDKITLPLSHLS